MSWRSSSARAAMSTLAMIASSAPALFGLRLLDQLGDTLVILAGRHEGEKPLPRLHRAGEILLDLVEDLPLVEVDRRIVRVDLGRLVEGVERGIGVTTDSHDETEVSHRVDIPRIALEDGLVGGDGLGVTPLGQALACSAEHARQHLGRNRLAGLEGDAWRAHWRTPARRGRDRGPGAGRHRRLVHLREA